MTADKTAALLADMPILPGNGGGTDRQAIRQEIERRAAGQRLTPAQRRIAQCMIEHSSELGFLSSMELADLANVSQPSVTRFAMVLGFEGYLEMRRFLRSGVASETGTAESETNYYQAAALSEAGNLAELAQSLADEELIGQFGQVLAKARPLAVLGLRASSGLATQFSYFASKVHPDIRLLANGGSLIEDQIEQCVAAGGDVLLAFLMPLYPREAINAIAFAKAAGMKVALVTDTAFADHDGLVDIALKARISNRLVFDSYAAPALLVSVLLDAMSAKMKVEAQKRLDEIDRSSKKRKVFAR